MINNPRFSHGIIYRFSVDKNQNVWRACFRYKIEPKSHRRSCYALICVALRARDRKMETWRRVSIFVGEKGELTRIEKEIQKERKKTREDTIVRARASCSSRKTLNQL